MTSGPAPAAPVVPAAPPVETLVELVARCARNDPLSRAIEAPGREPLRAEQLRTMVAEIGQAVRAAGATREDRVAIVLPNGPDMAVAFLGVASDAAVMRAVRDELAAVHHDRQATGWTSDLAARALAALRIAAALATGRHVAKIPAERTATPAAGQLLARGGLFGNVRSLVSGSTTSPLRAFGASAGQAAPSHVEDLDAALARFSNAAYGRHGGAPEALDSALESAGRAVAHIAREHSWLATKLRALTQSAMRIRQRAWAR